MLDSDQTIQFQIPEMFDTDSNADRSQYSYYTPRILYCNYTAIAECLFPANIRPSCSDNTRLHRSVSALIRDAYTFVHTYTRPQSMLVTNQWYRISVFFSFLHWIFFTLHWKWETLAIWYVQCHTTHIKMVVSFFSIALKINIKKMVIKSNIGSDK